LGHQATNDASALHASAHSHTRVVSEVPTPADRRAVQGARAEDARALRILRDHRELGAPRSLRARSSAHLANLARPSLSQSADELGTLPPPADPSPAAPAARRAQRLRAAM